MTDKYSPDPKTKGLAVVLAEDNYEELELHYPRLRLIVCSFPLQR